ncbi:MAG TPA: AIR synthase-related protein [Smithellaceae bacterium]|nr:AIR synthase-related protein [Smithellaceae bacterium]HOS08889.1 AIR synthase-related protein [Smithellaceae bacterium]HPD49325.1 AIR synthase-related protein [Smithellaceae bacterium]HPL49598.1 AIR synthase-related protein [Smithellaceae bacterium]HPM69701.1 AIR synthase-related protein [Smithellaceae bacterium]
MTVRIEVGFRQGIRDALGEKTRKRITDNLGMQVQRVVTIEVYTVAGELTAEELHQAASGPLCDSIIQEFSINRPLAKNFDWLIEVGFRPGVTDNVGKTAREAIALLLGGTLGERKINVYTSRQYLLSGTLTKADAERIAHDLLANDLIERYQVVGKEEFDFQNGLPAVVPQVTGKGDPQLATINLTQLDAKTLLKISQEKLLALNLEEMQTIAKYFADPAVVRARRKMGLDENTTDVELECLAQTWSEHCKHKIFNSKIDYFDGKTKKTINSLFKTYIKGSTARIRKAKGKKDFCLSVFVDNAGVIKFNNGYNLVFKVETHNSPAALDPYGAALTGIVGVNRDPFGTGLGAKLIFNTDVFCFASPYHKKKLPPRILHPRRIYEGVREGVEHGGNKSGIPTVNGSIVFDERFLGKPLVYCGTAGIMPAKINGKPTHEKEIKPGDVIIMAGGRIGKDGIHGATFSSEELHEGSPVTAVQIGDPITQKKMTDFLLQARNLGLYRALTDNGAGGLSSSVGEMATYSGGCEMDLSLAPLKYAGLQPWEILVSEAQERMSLAVDPKKVDKFMELARKMDVETTVLGKFTSSGKFHIRYGEKTVAYLDMDFLHEGVPQMKLVARWKAPKHPEPTFAPPADLGKALKQMLSRLNICSKESVVRQYDHEVQGGSVVKPLVGVCNDGPSDAAVIRPLLDSMEGVVVAHGICPRYSDIDAYWMTACVIDEAVRNAVAVGVDPDHLAGLDNFCWCDPVQSEKTPDGHFKLAQLVRANMAIFDITTVYGVPCISGKDSMKNDYSIGRTKISVPPTLLYSVIGKIPDVRQAVTMDAKRPQDLVYILGETRDELGGSEWFAKQGAIGNKVPQVEAKTAMKLYRALNKAIRAGLVASCHDCSDGGLGVALAETAFAGGLGLNVNLKDVPYRGKKRDDFILFSETASRFVVTIHPKNQAKFEKLMRSLVAREIGFVSNDGLLQISGLSGQTIIKEKIGKLKDAWQAPLNF